MAVTPSGSPASKPARLPDAAALFSPATDLSGGSASVLDNAERDAMFAGAALGNLADAYLNGADATQPLVSPLLGDLAGLPPLLVHVGEDECLRDDSLRLAQKARAAGVRVQLQVWAGVPHVWQLLPWLPEARQSVRLAADFLRGAKPLLESQPEPLDVLIVGAGLSGIGQAAHLQQHCADQRYAILESRPALGGTWDLFRYPGIRSDSDMYTLGYAFKPWTDAKAIADGPAILKYIQETARERGIDAQIRYGHRVVSAAWSSDDARWHVAVDVQAPALPGQPETAAPQRRYFSARFLLLCCGYYRYDQGHRPSWPGQADYTGQWVHPQAWPQNLSWQGQHVVVVGSGATAVTLLPELAKGAASVTMLQRSPTFMLNRPQVDALARWLKPWAPAMLAYRLVRLKNIALGMLFFKLARARPQGMARHLLGMAREQMGPGVDMANFTPRYKPWDQRICLLPDGDLFETVKAGHASIVTDEIERFTAQGIRLQSGRELAADIVVSATGLELNVLGDIQMQVDGVPVQPAETLAYKGMMFSGVPNLVYTFGYTNASWTLKADLTAQYTCRLINLMHRGGLHIATPQRDAQVQVAPFLDFTSGYVQRALAKLPKQGDRQPWRLYQNYLRDWLLLRLGRVREKHLRLQAVPDKAD